MTTQINFTMAKRFVLLAIILFFGASCDRVETEKIRSFVINYTLEFNKIRLTDATQNDNILLFWAESVDAVNWRSKDREKERYDSLCAVYNDLSYNRHIRYIAFPDEGYYYGGRIDDISVVSDTDFDAAHPAGTHLNDIVRLLSASPLEFLMSNYTKTYDWNTEYGTDFTEQIGNILLYSERKECHFPIDMLLSEIKAGDLELMGFGGDEAFIGYLKFEQMPETIKEHLLTVTVKTKAGKEYSAQIVKVFE